MYTKYSRVKDTPAGYTNYTLNVVLRTTIISF